MRAVIAVVLGSGIALFAFGCQASPTAPGEVSPAPVRQADLTGAWNGTASDTQGPQTLSWTMTQANATVSGTVVAKAVDPADGTCASCHKNKIGTFSGTISGSDITLTMTFPAGHDAEPTPMCGVTVTVTGSTHADGRITGTYRGADSCEGPFADGTLAMVRQPMSMPLGTPGSTSRALGTRVP